MANIIKKGDTVQVIRGDERGKRGKVLRVVPKADRVVIENINYVKKHLRRSQKHPQGGRVEMEAPVDISNVMVVCPDCGVTTRLSTVRADVGSKTIKQRKCKKCSAQF